MTADGSIARLSSCTPFDSSPRPCLPGDGDKTCVHPGPTLQHRAQISRLSALLSLRGGSQVVSRTAPVEPFQNDRPCLRTLQNSEATSVHDEAEHWLQWPCLKNTEFLGTRGLFLYPSTRFHFLRSCLLSNYPAKSSIGFMPLLFFADSRQGPEPS